MRLRRYSAAWPSTKTCHGGPPFTRTIIRMNVPWATAALPDCEPFLRVIPADPSWVTLTSFHCDTMIPCTGSSVWITGWS